MSIPEAIFCWSGGKDSAYCLNKVLSERSFNVRYLLTTLSAEHHRISMHGVRESLLDMQAEALGIPMLKVWVHEGTNEAYEKQMEAVLTKARAEGIYHVIFGDINLEDLRAYRENNLKKAGMQGVFPLWQMDTKLIINDFVTQGFKSILCCTNDGYLGEEWAGRDITQSFIDELPDNVDPCGENGEYHSFCYAGPIFKHEISYKTGEKVYRPLDIKTQDAESTHIITRGFWFCDLE